MSTLSLNSRQQEAVVYNDGPLLVLAGAGSGKTRVLTQRIIHFIRDLKVSPWRIFAVTFTNKAAKEMKHRVVEELGPSANDLWISTFHSSCLRILRRHAEALGYGRGFAIYDTSDQTSLIKAVLESKEMNDKFFKPSVMLSHIDKAKNAGLGPEQFATGGDYFLGKVKEVYVGYQKELLRNQAMDFGDLILNVTQLFKKRPDILAEYQQQFQYVLVDEYQDTNPVQYELIKLLATQHQNVFVVGDDDQSIYKFRGAEIQNILNFQKDYPNAKLVRLEQNYRSTQNILTASNAIIRKNKERMGKELWTDNHAGDEILVMSGENERDEAIFVARQINALKDEFRLSEMAILYRTNAQSRSLEDELRKNHIPYKIFGGMKFYERAEIKDTLAYLRVLVNRADSVSLKRILNVPARGIGKTTVDKIDLAAMTAVISFWDVICRINDPVFGLALSPATIIKIKSFVALIEKIDKARTDLPLDEFLPFLYEQTGYWQMLSLEKTVEAESRKENLTEFVNVVEEFLESAPETKLGDFLDLVSLASDVDKLAENDPFVTLMTIHLCKGLEFPVVFLVGLEEGLFPHARSLDREEDIEEERRLCYVGMTRAKKKLFLCYAGERRIFGSAKFNFPSRFLEDLPSDVIRQIGRATPTQRPQSYSQSYQSSSSERTTPAHMAFNQRSAHSTHNLNNSNHRVIDREYAQDEQTLSQGMRVRHSVFGEGMVKSYEGSGDHLKVTIKFKNGMEKKLLFKHAHLEVL